MKKLKDLFKSSVKTDRTDLVITKDNHDVNADELAAYIRNLEAENKDLKDTTSEYNTISYKLGKTIIDTLNKQSSSKKLPTKLLKIYTESRKRKLSSIKNANLVDKALIFLTDENLLEDYQLIGDKQDVTNKLRNTNTQKDFTTALGSAPSTVEKKQPIMESKLENNLVDILNKEILFVDEAGKDKRKSEELVNITIKDSNVTELAHVGVQEAGDTLEVSAAVLYRFQNNINSRKAVVLLEFLDIAGNKIQDITLDNIGVSAAFKQHFRYLNNNCTNIKESLKSIIKFQLPTTVASIKISVAGMGIKDDGQIDVRLEARCYNEDKKKSEELVNITIKDSNVTELAHVGVQEAGDTLEVSAAVLYRFQNNINSRKAVVLLEFLDIAGNKIQDITLDNIGVSAAFKQHFRYLNNNCTNIKESLKSIIKFQLPTTVASIKISVAGMGIKDDGQIDVRLEARCYNEDKEKNKNHQKLVSQTLPEPFTSDPLSKRYTSDLNVACILDEFTTECLDYEVNLVKVTQEDWQSEMESNNIDFLLVESCWRGNNSNWGTLTKGSSGGRKLSPLLQYCKNNHIPTVFWNKEDPPHYDKFGAIAKLFDVAITTDINMVERYKADFGIDVYPLSFGAQPKIHNPSPIIQKLEKAVFAGSYYGDKPQRCADFNDIMSQLETAQLPYDIFDRNYNRNIDKFIFPSRYQNHIIGTLPPEDIWKVHKGYKYQINMNTVQDSSTMFARRVYESLASGTPIITNDSVGVRELFGDLVVMPNEHLSVAEQLIQLESSPNIYNKIARLGVRRVMRKHTYGHRIQEICKLIGMDVEVTVPEATLAITVNNDADIVRAKKIFELQTAIAKHLFIELENFESAYHYLNKSDSNISYAMKLGHEFYNNDNKYYGSDKVLKCNANDAIAAEALEDFSYWGEL